MIGRLLIGQMRRKGYLNIRGWWKSDFSDSQSFLGRNHCNISALSRSYTRNRRPGFFLWNLLVSVLTSSSSGLGSLGLFCSVKFDTRETQAELWSCIFLAVVTNSLRPVYCPKCYFKLKLFHDFYRELLILRCIWSCRITDLISLKYMLDVFKDFRYSNSWIFLLVS